MIWISENQDINNVKDQNCEVDEIDFIHEAPWLVIGNQYGGFGIIKKIFQHPESSAYWLYVRDLYGNLFGVDVSDEVFKVICDKSGISHD